MLDAFANSAIAAALTAHPVLYILASACHIFGIGLVVGAIVPLDLRLIGLWRTAPLGAIAPILVRVALVGLAIAIASGLLLFSVRAQEYASNPAFLAKIALVAAGVANALALHWRWRAGWPVRPDPVSRVMATTSLAIWIVAVLAGRWIGFV